MAWKTFYDGFGNFLSDSKRGCYLSPMLVSGVLMNAKSPDVESGLFHFGAVR